MRAVTFASLTSDQQRFVQYPTSRHVAGIGAPGSGKTLVLVHRARFLIERGYEPERMRLVTYTNALEDYIRASLREFGLPEEMVINYDALMRELHEDLTGRRVRIPKDLGEDERYNFVRDAVGSLVEDRMTGSLFPPKARWDAVFVDEAQDLSASDIITLSRLSRHVTVVLDARQQLYERGAPADQILHALDLRFETSTFLSTFRCSRAVTAIAAAVAADAEDRAALPRTVGIARNEITSRRVLASDRAVEDEFFHSALRARMSETQSIAVLLPTNFYAYGLAKALREAGFDVEDKKSLDMTTSAVKVLTYHSAKGLSFDSVFLPRLHESEFARAGRQNRTGLLFVGLTRATTYLFLSTVKGKEIREWTEFDAVTENHLETIDATALPVGAVVAALPTPVVDDYYDDFL
jgi:superfamily I DNA/RNA helicase